MKTKTFIPIVIFTFVLASCATPSPEQIRTNAWFFFIVGVLRFLVIYNALSLHSDYSKAALPISLFFVLLISISLLGTSATDLLLYYYLIIVLNLLVRFLYVSFSNKPESLKNGYLLDDDGYKWQTYTINYFRVHNGNVPLWSIPARQWNSDDERGLLKKAILLYYEARNAIKRHAFSGEIQRPLLYQCFLIPQNIANGLWKLANLRRLISVTDGITLTKAHELENTILQKEIIQEMEFLVEKLSSLSLSLLKSEITRDNKIIENILHEISNSNNKLLEKISPDNLINKVQQKSNFYYVAIFLILVVAFAVVSVYAPSYALPSIIIGSLLGFVTIGLFQLRSDKNIKDESFTKVIVEILKTIRLIK